MCRVILVLWSVDDTGEEGGSHLSVNWREENERGGLGTCPTKTVGYSECKLRKF